MYAARQSHTSCFWLHVCQWLTFVVKAPCIDIAAVALAVQIVVFVQLLVQVLPRLIIPEEEQRRRK